MCFKIACHVERLLVWLDQEVPFGITSELCIHVHQESVSGKSQHYTHTHSRVSDGHEMNLSDCKLSCSCCLVLSCVHASPVTHGGQRQLVWLSSLLPQESQGSNSAIRFGSNASKLLSRPQLLWRLFVPWGSLILHSALKGYGVLLVVVIISACVLICIE